MKVFKKNKVEKKSRNVVIPFSDEKRIDYVTGFRKRKKERKERAVVYNEAKARKEKLAARSQRRKQAQALLDAYEANAVKQKEYLDAEFSSSDDDDEDERKTRGSTDHGGVTLTNTVTTQCGGATVEIATLGLSTNHFLGSNVDFASCKLDSSSIRRHGHALNLGRYAPLPKKAEPEDQSFSELVKDVMKKVKKKAKKTGDQISLKSNSKKDTNKIKKKQKIVVKKSLVTDL